jgi:FtsH-binding integral membrane protein
MNDDDIRTILVIFTFLLGMLFLFYGLRYASGDIVADFSVAICMFAVSIWMRLERNK